MAILAYVKVSLKNISIKDAIKKITDYKLKHNAYQIKDECLLFDQIIISGYIQSGYRESVSIKLDSDSHLVFYENPDITNEESAKSIAKRLKNGEYLSQTSSAKVSKSSLKSPPKPSSKSKDKSKNDKSKKDKSKKNTVTFCDNDSSKKGFDRDSSSDEDSE